MGFIRWLIGLAIAIALSVFAVFNRTSVSVTWNPFSAPVELPLYLAALTFIAAGFVLGVLVVWMNTDPLHLEKRRQRKHIKDLEKQLETLHEKGGKEAPADFFPALPAKMK